MSGGAAKYVKFRSLTLLFFAKHIGSDCESGKRSRGLSSTLGGNRDARAVRCSGLMGFSGLRFGLRSRRGGGWNWVGVVSGLFNPNDSGVGALERRPRHDEGYHEGGGCGR